MYRRLLHILVLLVIFAPVPALGLEGFGSLISPGKLAKSHAKYEGISNCTECHVLTGGVTDKRCLDCHEKLDKKIKAEKSAHAKYTKKCIACHRDHKGRRYQMINLDEDKFEHDDTGYELVFEHEQVKCSKCHLKAKKNKYSGLKQECVECHDNAHKRQFKGRDCEECHTERSWEEETFKHESLDYEGYKLTGKHKKVECSECHVRGRFRPIKTKTCNSSLCHDNEHKKQFKGQKCKDCHTTKDWEEETFKHDSPDYDGYKLEGKHVDVKCAECHVKGKYKPIKTKTCDSAACHNSNEHKDQFKGQSCDECHTVKGWDVDAFDHDSKDYDGYKLEGKHRDVKCAECHVKGKYKPIKQTCITCHEDDDDHKNELGKVCETCHNVDDWNKVKLDHKRKTDFPLIGKHNTVGCNECHTEKKGDRRIWKNDLFECEDCHDDYHEGEYEEKCKSCHTQYDWEPRNYKHYEKTGYELEGAHNDTRCTNCHVSGSGQFKNVNRICEQCHLTPHFNQFGGDCEACHTSTNWAPSKFDHALTGFFLAGNHRNVECSDCHTSRVYRNTSTECIDCHRETYNTAIVPQENKTHAQLAYPFDCRQCHLVTFIGWDFNHTTVGSDCATCHTNETRDLVTHANYGTDCALCHSVGATWTWEHPSLNSGAQCSSCHLGYSNIPRSAKHDAGGWISCEECHNTTTAWLPPSFNHSGVSNGCARCHLSYTGLSSPARTTPHNLSQFGGQGDILCEECHRNSDGPLWPFAHSLFTTTCMPCHLTYSSPLRSTSPTTNHLSFTSFETSCELCHSTANKNGPWTPANYHTNNPGATTGCSSCHLSNTTPARTTLHNTGTFGGVGDTLCETCHSTGGNWAFEHDINATNCVDCHASTITTPALHNYFGTTCGDCHTQTGVGGSWTSPAPLFTLHSGSAGLCDTCHGASTNYYSGFPGQIRSNTTNVGAGTRNHSDPDGRFGSTGNDSCDTCHPSTAAWTFTHAPVPTNCNSCHNGYSTPLRNNTITHTAFGATEFICEECHDSKSSWAPPTKYHTLNTVTSGCDSCHPAYTSTLRTTSHTTGSFGSIGDTLCETCHTTGGNWAFEHDVNATNCVVCHASTITSTTLHSVFGTTCGECHSPTYAPDTWTSPAPSYSLHASSAGVCDTCHGATTTYFGGLNPSIFYRSNTTSGTTRNHSEPDGRFGSIGNDSCDTCHPSTAAWTFTHAPVPTNCNSCHNGYSTPLRDNTITHTAFGATEFICEECHDSKSSWAPPTKYHTLNTVTSGCDSCHPAYTSTLRTTNHATGSFGSIGDTLCETCHTTGGNWAFEHDVNATNCVVCHASTITSTTLHSVFGTTCGECHSPTYAPDTWTSPVPSYSLHASSAGLCDTCHGATTTYFGGLNPSIFYRSNTTNVGAGTRNHSEADGRFGSTGNDSCDTCHLSTSAWSFTHAVTLTNCNSCHNGYSTPVRNTNVLHTNFTNETLCEECHSPAGVGSSWKPPDFNHSGVTSGCLPCHTAYTGANTKTAEHTTNNWITCEQCHLNTGVNWIFNHNLAQGVVCNSCHLNTSNPPKPASHKANNWVDCEVCHHSSTSWGSSISYNHNTQFPVPPKGHKGFNDCNDCHPGGNFNNSGGCIECHRRERENVHNEGQGNAGCLNCHPRGK